MIVAGGSDAAINESGIGGFSALKPCQHKRQPFGSLSSLRCESRWFCNGRRRRSIGIGDYEHAITWSKHTGEIIGGGQADAYHLTGTHQRTGRTLGLQSLGRGSITPEQVDYINLHATSPCW